MSGFDLSATATELLSRCGVVSWTDANWFTLAEVCSYFDEAANKLATMGLFCAQNTQDLTPGTAEYTLGLDWLDTVIASVNGSRLLPSSAADLEALDSNWMSASCTNGQYPGRYSMDAGPIGTITVYPMPVALVPAVTQELETVDFVTAATITPSQTLAPINPLLADYFLYWALWKLRGKESPYSLPEIADFAQEKCQQFEAIFAKYWGAGE